MERAPRWYRVGVTFENTAVALAKTASDALRDLDQHGPHLRPQNTDRFGWSADVLDELARVAELLGRAVEHTTGVSDGDVSRHARELATAVIAHRNTLLRHGGGHDPLPVGGDRHGGTAGPRDGGHRAALPA